MCGASGPRVTRAFPPRLRQIFDLPALRRQLVPPDYAYPPARKFSCFNLPLHHPRPILAGLPYGHSVLDVTQILIL